MYDAKLTITPGPAKPPTVFEWADLKKDEILEDLELMFLEGLIKLNGMAVAVLDGDIPEAPTTNPVEVVIEFVITKDGEKWHRTVLEYPGMGEEAQAMFLGTLTGEMSRLSRSVRNKTRKTRGKGKR